MMNHCPFPHGNEHVCISQRLFFKKALIFSQPAVIWHLASGIWHRSSASKIMTICYMKFNTRIQDF
jgi:hypothetical protein